MPAGALSARLFLAAAALLPLASPPPVVALETDDRYAEVARLMSDSRRERRAAAAAILAAGDRSLVPALVDAVFFTPRIHRAEILEVLEGLTGAEGRNYYDWVEFVGAHEELAPGDGYLVWKLSLLQRIDPDYGRVLYPGAPARIRLEEIISGGVPVAGIPALDDPPTVAAAEAGFMRDRERVFGLRVGGAARAYPVRVLSWHEMANDVVGGEPITLSFCTLCGSGIVYSTRTPAGDAYTFDTSGLLYRSNKLMLDRQTWTLWSNLTGEPVVGRRARGPTRLEMLPATLTTWGEWRRLHPDTRVLDVRRLAREVGDRLGYDYRTGAADRARAGVSFPVWLQSDRLERDAEVFALRVGGAAKAYPVDRVLRLGIVNDTVGEVALVLVGDADSGSVRAYRRGGHRFRRAAARLVDEEDRTWTLTEEALLPPAGAGAPLARLAGHVAFWFGWYAFYPHTEVFEGGAAGGG